MDQPWLARETGVVGVEPAEIEDPFQLLAVVEPIACLRGSDKTKLA